MDRASLINSDCFFNAFGFITTTVKLNTNVTTKTCIKNNEVVPLPLPVNFEFY